MAPSIHNTQPWLFRPHDGTIDVLADRRRHLKAIDPDRRALYVSIGAALLNLQVALRAQGRVSRLLLLPDPGQPDLCATVDIGQQVPSALGAGVERRHPAPPLQSPAVRAGTPYPAPTCAPLSPPRWPRTTPC